MEVRTTQSYTVVIKYTNQARMGGVVHGQNFNMASSLTATYTVAVTPKGWMMDERMDGGREGWMDKWNTSSAKLSLTYFHTV